MRIAVERASRQASESTTRPRGERSSSSGNAPTLAFPQATPPPDVVALQRLIQSSPASRPAVQMPSSTAAAVPPERSEATTGSIGGTRIGGMAGAMPSSDRIQSAFGNHGHPLDAYAYKGRSPTAGVQRAVAPQPKAPTDLGTDLDADSAGANRINQDQRAKSSTVTERQVDGTTKTIAFQRVYTIQGTDCLVFLPPKGLTPKAEGSQSYEPEVFVFFHGIKANLSQEKGQTSNANASTNRTNPAKQADLARSVAASGRNVIAILPQGRDTDGGARPTALDPGGTGFAAMVQGVLDGVKGDLGAATVEARRISLAGHSGGGLAVEAAMAQLGGFSDQVTNITLMDAGYYQFAQLRTWLFEGKDGKTLQIVWNAGQGTHAGSRQGTQTPFSFASLKTTAVAAGLTAEKLTSAAEGEQRMAGGTVEEVTQIKKDGNVHAIVTVIHVSREFGQKDREKYKGAVIGHEASRDDFMTAAMGEGGVSFGAVEKGTTYLVTATDARLRDRDAQWAPITNQPPIAKGKRVKVLNGPQLKKYVEVGPAEGGSSLGWTSASNLGPDLGEGANKGLATIQRGSGFMETDGDSHLDPDLLDKVTRFGRYLLDNKAASSVRLNTGARSAERAHRWSTKRSIRTSAAVRNNVRTLVSSAGVQGTDEDGNYWGAPNWTDDQIIAQASVVVTDFSGNAPAAEGYAVGSVNRKPNSDGPSVTNHLAGNAIDATIVVTNNSKFLAAIPRFGLKRPLLNLTHPEPWHYESST